jgi:hypothetical protein
VRNAIDARREEKLRAKFGSSDINAVAKRFKPKLVQAIADIEELGDYFGYMRADVRLALRNAFSDVAQRCDALTAKIDAANEPGRVVDMAPNKQGKSA